MIANAVPLTADDVGEYHPKVAKYTDNPDFNDALDAEYGVIEIAEVPFSPSLILHTMDPEGYHAALLEFRQQQLDDFKDEVCQRFPTPIANRFYKVEHGSVTYLEKLSALKDLWEAVIYTLYALVVGEFRSLGLSMHEAQTVSPSNTENRKPEKLKLNWFYSDKLADRIGITVSLVQLASDKGLDVVLPDIVTLDILEKIRGLKGARNEFAHDETKSEEQAQRLFTAYYEDVLSVLGLLRGLADVALLRFDGTEKKVFECRFETFEGYAMTRHFRTVTLSMSQHGAYSPYLSTDNIVAMYKGRIYSTSPFLHFVSRDEGHLTKLCFYKYKEGSEENQEFFFGVVGESKNEKIPARTFAPAIAELHALVAPPAKGGAKP